jgi:hypothetical protein
MPIINKRIIKKNKLYNIWYVFEFHEDFYFWRGCSSYKEAVRYYKEMPALSGYDKTNNFPTGFERIFKNYSNYKKFYEALK